jgi:hypothetical protein
MANPGMASFLINFMTNAACWEGYPPLAGVFQVLVYSVLVYSATTGADRGNGLRRLASGMGLTKLTP